MWGVDPVVSLLCGMLSPSHTSQPPMVWDILGPFYLHSLTLIPTWINNHMPRKVGDGITHPIPNFHCLSFGINKELHSYNGCNCLSMMGLKLNHVSKRGPWCVIFGHLLTSTRVPLPVTSWRLCGIASSWQNYRLSHRCKMLYQGWSLIQDSNIIYSVNIQ